MGLAMPLLFRTCSPNVRVWMEWMSWVGSQCIGQPGKATFLRGHIAVVEWLESQGASLTIMSRDGGTPMHVAAQEGHTEVVSLLASQEASLSAATKKGWQPMHVAAQE